MTTRVRTFLELADLLAVDSLVAIGDHLVRRPRFRFEQRTEPYVTTGQLRAEAAAFTGRGARSAREAVQLVRMSSDSPAETRLRLAFLRACLPEPLANAPASEPRRGRAGVVDLGEPDLHWPRWRVAVEHEGPSHLDRDQLERDIERGERRREAGWTEIRTTAKDLRDGCRPAIRRVRTALEQRGWRP